MYDRLRDDLYNPMDPIVEEGYDGQRDSHPCLGLKKLLGDGTFYYSSDFDLTRRLQKRYVDSNRLIWIEYGNRKIRAPKLLAVISVSMARTC